MIVFPENYLHLDFEVFPWLAYGYGKHYEPIICQEKYPKKIICVAYCFGEGAVKFKAVWDFPGYRKGLTINDYHLVKWIAEEILPKTDTVSGWNSDKYDLRVLYERMLHHNISPPRKLKTNDGLKIYRKYFDNPTNKLGYVAEKYGEDGKISHEGTSLYIEAGLGSEKHQKILKTYNIQDTKITRERVRIGLEWDNRPNPIWENRVKCVCGGDMNKHKQRMLADGRSYTQYQCKSCGAYKKGQQIIEKVC